MTQFWLNGQAHTIPAAPLLLLDYLREHQLTGSKGPCREGDCGACQVLVCDDPQPAGARFRAHTSCLVRVNDLAGQHVLTIEGLQQDGQGHQRPVAERKPGLLQECLADAGASQCGFCSPGLVMGCINWLLNGPQLSVAEGEHWLNGNLCRCTGYMGQRRAIQQLADRLGERLRASGNRLAVLVDAGILPPFLLQAPAELNAQPDSAPTATSNIIVGGGTDLLLQQALASLPPGNRLAHQHDPVIRPTPDGLLLNARQPLQRIADALARASLLPAFARFNALFASLPIRNRATLGGNLAHASPVADSIPLLQVLNARLHTSKRTLSLPEFFTGFKQTCLQENESIEWIQLPPETASAFIHFDKVSRRGTTDIATVNCAGCWQVEQHRIANVRLAIGGASPMPVRLQALEDALRGQPLNALLPVATSPLLHALLDQHLQGSLSPITDLRGSAHYRRLLARQLVLAQLHALAQAAEMPQGESA